MSDALSTRQQQQLVLSGTGPTSESLDLEHIIVEILLRLPPRSLVRFRCVCKAWRVLISDPYFIREHLSRVHNSDAYSLLVKEMSTFRSIDSEALFKCSSHEDGPVPSRELCFPVIDPPIAFDYIRFVGSCNGLICLRLHWYISVFGLWNPCTREIKVLPKPPVEDFHSAFYGFGYDSTTDDYKVIVGDLRYNSSQEPSYEYTVLVYTVRTGSWRMLKPLNHSFKLFGEGCLVNGALYWVRNQNEPYKLASFDLTEEKFHEISLPHYPIQEDVHMHLVASAGKFRNSLVSYCGMNNGFEFIIWVMKEAGVEKSWNEIIKIPKEVVPVLEGHRRIFWKHMFISDVSVTFIRASDLETDCVRSFLRLYNPKENRCRNVTEACVPEACVYDAVTYVETLVSPFTSTGM